MFFCMVATSPPDADARALSAVSTLTFFVRSPPSLPSNSFTSRGAVVMLYRVTLSASSVPFRSTIEPRVP